MELSYNQGYTQSGFNSWTLLEQLAKSFKRNQQTEKPPDPQPGKEDDESFNVQISAKKRYQKSAMIDVPRDDEHDEWHHVLEHNALHQ